MRTLADYPRQFVVAALYIGLAVSLVPWMVGNHVVLMTQLCALVVGLVAIGRHESPTWDWMAFNLGTMPVLWGFWSWDGGNSTPAAIYTVVSVAAWIGFLYGSRKERQVAVRSDEEVAQTHRHWQFFVVAIAFFACAIFLRVDGSRDEASRTIFTELGLTGSVSLFAAFTRIGSNTAAIVVLWIWFQFIFAVGQLVFISAQHSYVDLIGRGNAFAISCLGVHLIIAIWLTLTTVPRRPPKPGP